MRKKKKDEQPLPPMFVGDKEPSATGRLSDLVGKSLVRSEVPHVTAEEQPARAPDRAEAGAAAADDDVSLPGCLAWIGVTVGILGYLGNADLPGQLEIILAFVVLLAAPGLFWWSIIREERRRARESRLFAPDSPPAQVAAPPPEDPPAVP